MNKADQETCIDPSNSVVVTACAGSGKTWLLTSRIIRIILDNIDNLEIDAGGEGEKQPAGSFRLSSILAITFTKNATAEIEERVRDRLREMAHANEEGLDKLLAEIGLAGKCSSGKMQEAYRKFLLARPRLSVFTFHSWFNHLINYLPWSERPNLNSQPTDNPRHFKALAWQETLTGLNDESKNAETQKAAKAMRMLLGYHSLRSLKELFDTLIDKRAEWFLYFGCRPEDVAAYAVFEQKMKKDFPEPRQRAFKKDLLGKEFIDELNSFLKSVEATGKKPGMVSKALTKIRAAQEHNSASYFHQKLIDVLLVEKTIRPIAEDPAHGIENNYKKIEARLRAITETEAYDYNLACARINLLYARKYAELKGKEGVIDYADMEIFPLRALFQDASGKTPGQARSQAMQDLFQRLETSYQHILVDEFQDTSPTQWLMLKTWLTNSVDKPKVFIVGDPKQSIFSWRSSNPKLLDAARNYLKKEPFCAKERSVDTTRRCSQSVIDLVNAVFEGAPGFNKHDTLNTATAGSVTCLPKLSHEAVEQEEEAQTTLRNPLINPAEEKEESVENAKFEGEALSEVIKKIKADSEHKYGYQDFMLLHPARTHAQGLTDGLAIRKIRCGLIDRAGRMDYLECQDMLALLHAIFDPGYGLMVAQVLRSPVFDVTEEDLWAVYKAGGGGNQQECDWVAGLEDARGGPGLERAQGWLVKWREAYQKEKLPAHELLARCYRDAGIVKNYARKVPPETAKRVVLNLEWVLNYSLEVMGGKMALPSEYAEHLRKLQEADEEISPVMEHEGVVQSLTVHSAKGLESPVVAIANSNYSSPSIKAHLLVSWDLENSEHQPSHVSFYRSEKASVAKQLDALKILKEMKKQEKCNLLYVALTRAKEHLVVSMMPKKKDVKGWWNEIESKLLGLGAEKADGGSLRHIAKVEIRADEESGPAKNEGNRVDWPDLKELDTSTIKTKKKDPASEESIRGTQLHNLLALILQGVTNEGVQRRLLGIGKDKQKELMRTVNEILDSKTDFGKLLANKKNIECELPAVDGDGKSKRIDCLLTAKDGTIWVLDFKTGDTETPEKEHDKQMRGYCKIVKENYPNNTDIKMAIVDKEGKLREVKPE